MDLKALECRVEPVKLTKYKIEQPGSNTVKAKKNMIIIFVITAKKVSFYIKIELKEMAE